jgi:heme A synthase
MMTGLYFAHSGIRYLVLLFGLLGILYFAYGYFARRPFDRTANILRIGYVATLDIQVLLGLAMVFMGFWYPALAGHLLLMVIAVVVAHAAAVVAKRAVVDERRYATLAVAWALTLVLIVGGIMAIGRSVLGTGAAPAGL